MKRINEKNYKIYIAIIVAVICSMLIEKINAQSWTNSTTVSNGAYKIEPTSIANYNLQISTIDNKFYIPKNPFINGYYTYNTNFSNIDSIGFPEFGAYLGKFLYKTNDTTFYNQGYFGFNRYLNQYGKLDNTNNILVKKINDSLPNIQLGNEQIWTGKYIFSYNFDNQQIQILNKNYESIFTKNINCNPTTKYINTLNTTGQFNYKFKLQVINENSVILTYFQEEAQSNNYTLFTKKYVFHSNNSISEENITEITGFNISLVNEQQVDIYYTICDITYTNSLDTMVMAINNNSGVNKQLPSVFNTTIQNGNQGYYVFKNNTPSSTKNIKTNNVLVYPNPSVDGNVYFGSNDTELKLIYDLSGREIQSTRENKIHLESGIYIIKINGVNNKVIIQ